MAALKSTARRHRGARAAGVPDVGAARQLEGTVRTLRLVLDILIVCDSALRMQGAEQDEEIANVLRHCGSYRLQNVIEEMERLDAEC